MEEIVEHASESLRRRFAVVLARDADLQLRSESMARLDGAARPGRWRPRRLRSPPQKVQALSSSLEISDTGGQND
jgi:hypothetical protein